MNIDETIAQMMADESEDARYITPVDYGKLRGIKPQLIYYYIRRQYITTMRCGCGRRVIEKEEADEYLRSIGKLKPDGEGPPDSAAEPE
jgi:hypothetical protein